MTSTLKSTLNYFAGSPNLASQVKLQKIQKAELIHGKGKPKLKSAFYSMANLGVMRWSLLTVLPFGILAIISSQVRGTQSTQVINMKIPAALACSLTTVVPNYC